MGFLGNEPSVLFMILREIYEFYIKLKKRYRRLRPWPEK